MGRLQFGDCSSVKGIALHGVSFFCINILALCLVGSWLMTSSGNRDLLLLQASFFIRPSAYSGKKVQGRGADTLTCPGALGQVNHAYSLRENSFKLSTCLCDSEGETAKGKTQYEVRGHIFSPFSVIHEMPSGSRVGFFSSTGFGFLLSNPGNHRKTHT